MDTWYFDNLDTCGAFVWTGFDYLGEPTPYASDYYYPAKTSNFGLIDSAGFRKDAFYMF